MHPFVRYMIVAGAAGGVFGAVHGMVVSKGKPLATVKHGLMGIHMGMSAPLYVPIYLFGEPGCPRIAKIRDALLK